MVSNEYEKTAFTQKGTEIDLWLSDCGNGHRFDYDIFLSVDGDVADSIGHVDCTFYLTKELPDGTYDTEFEWNANDDTNYLDDAISICAADSGRSVAFHETSAMSYDCVASDGSVYHLGGTIAASPCYFDGNVRGRRVSFSHDMEDAFDSFNGVARYYAIWAMDELNKAGV